MGIIIGLLAATAATAQGTVLKKLAGLNPNFLTWVRMVSGMPVLAALVTIFGLWAVPPLIYWIIILFVTVPLEILLAYLGTRALHLSPISIVAPFAAFTSIFLMPVGYTILGELPTFLGIFGVLLIVIGTFFLGWNFKEGLFLGLRNVFSERGSIFALVSAFLASITISVAKFTFNYASPLLSAFYIVALLALVLTPIIFFQSRGVLRVRARYIGGLGITSGFGLAMQYVGLSLLPAVYFISIKRMSMVMDVFSGRVFFKEMHFRQRLAGSVLMVIGVILIAVG